MGLLLEQGSVSISFLLSLCFWGFVVVLFGGSFWFGLVFIGVCFYRKQLVTSFSYIKQSYILFMLQKKNLQDPS